MNVLVLNPEIKFSEKKQKRVILLNGQKNPFDYKGFIKVRSAPQAEQEDAMRAVAAHVMGENEC